VIDPASMVLAIEARCLAALRDEESIVAVTIDRSGIYATDDKGHVYLVRAERVATTHPGSAVHSEDRPDAGRLPPTPFHFPRGH
jgi:hypothetical protein